MAHFETLNLSNALRNAVEDLGFENPTPIQEAAFPLVLSGRDMVGIAQTGTGKTFAYLLPILNNLKFSNQPNPRVLILVPTRELVLQVVEQAELLTKYMSVRVMGVYGGTNIKMQRVAVADGMDVLVATPGRLYDLVLSRSIELKAVKKLVIDEVDVMLDLGFRFQITNFFELLPEKKQSIMFSATMTEDVEILIDDYFIAPEKIYIALSGTPLANIKQSAYAVPNFYTKANLVIDLVSNKSKFHKVLIFVPNKRSADRLFGVMQEIYDNDLCIIHSNKTQNYRIRSLRQFNVGAKRIMIATDVIARGLDLDKISHVINFDVPIYPENYMHRIGRTGRAEEEGQSILLFTEKERQKKEAIEKLMDFEIPLNEWPELVEISKELTPEEKPIPKEINSAHKHKDTYEAGPAFHEKKEKNKRENWGSAYKRAGNKYKKPKTRGDKRANNK